MEDILADLQTTMYMKGVLLAYWIFCLFISFLKKFNAILYTAFKIVLGFKSIKYAHE